MALGELAEPNRQPLLVALNDGDFRPALESGWAVPDSSQWAACGRRKLRFVRSVLRLSRDSDRILCGHVRQLSVAWLAQRLRPRLRYYLVAHGVEVWRPFNWLERVALRGAERVLCVSAFTRERLLDHCRLPENRADVLPNSLDPRFAIRAGRPLAECPPIILAVSRLNFADRAKGIEDLIRAMPEVRRRIPSATLRIVGRGDDVARLQGLAAELQVQDAIRFLGYLPDAGRQAELESCRLFALPSSKEGFGLVFIEAMACARPCLGARVGGIPEVITPETGLLVDPGSIPALAEALVRGLQQEWRESDLLERARAFSYPVFRHRLGELLRSPAGA